MARAIGLVRGVCLLVSFSYCASGCASGAAAIPGAAAEAAKPAWPPRALADKLDAEPKEELDRRIKTLIEEWEARIAKLEAPAGMVSRAMPSLHDNLRALYNEYNAGSRGKRYPKCHFTVEQCLDWWKKDMKFLVADCLEKGVDPAEKCGGRWMAKCCWVPATKMLVRYDLIAPAGYDRSKKHPVLYTFQSGPSMAQMKRVPYFLIQSVQKGYPKSMVHLEAKTRAIIIDAAREASIDPFRVYGTGHSYGGHTTLLQAYRHPDWFAAVCPLNSDLRRPKQIEHTGHIITPSLLSHGTGDSFRVSGKKVFETMKAGGNCVVEWQDYDGGHTGQPVFAGDIKKITDFCDKHVLDPYPKKVVHVVEHKRYSRAFWIDVILVKDMGGANAVVEVVVKPGNVIELTASDQVQAVDMYLAAELVDMKKPVKVLSGGRTLFSGPVADKITVKIRDGAKFWQRKQKALWEEIRAVQGGGRG